MHTKGRQAAVKATWRSKRADQRRPLLVRSPSTRLKRSSIVNGAGAARHAETRAAGTSRKVPLTPAFESLLQWAGLPQRRAELRLFSSGTSDIMQYLQPHNFFPAHSQWLPWLLSGEAMRRATVSARQCKCVHTHTVGKTKSESCGCLLCRVTKCHVRISAILHACAARMEIRSIIRRLCLH